MLEPTRLPDLTFPTVTYPKFATPWDLAVLLYKGASAVNLRKLGKKGFSEFGNPDLSRLDLVVALHVEINYRLVSGGLLTSTSNDLHNIKRLFTWAENNHHPLTLETVQSTYLAWSEFLLHEQRVAKRLSLRTAYGYASSVSHLLDLVLDRQTPLIPLTRLRWSPKRKSAQSVRAEKQNLEHTFTFGHALQDICDELTLDHLLKSPIPVRICLRTGQEYVSYSGQRAKNPGTLKRIGSEPSLKIRYALVNLRLEAELLMFVGQTGMNIGQANAASLRNFRYVSHLNGYQVKERKNRRDGEVLFEIFKDYKPHFERYLNWRRSICANSDRLFPFQNYSGDAPVSKFLGANLRKFCSTLGIKFIAPRDLRNTRVNWLLRRSSDPDLTAEMMQSTKETLLNIYERPSQQRAISEIARFWHKVDSKSIVTSIGPGECNGVPIPISAIPAGVTKPDCQRASGCLWCEHHRDLDQFEYVWSLTSFQYLKSIELSRQNGTQAQYDASPLHDTLKRIGEKLKWYEQSNTQRREWVTEARLRMDEGDYHEDWRANISTMEGTP